MEIDLDYDTLDEEYFPQMADILFNHSVFVINEKRYRLAEIEFYLRSDNHPDLYTHQNPEQLRLHTIYFHRFGNGTYKGGTFKGMDFTFGSEDDDVYFGVLIRSIIDIENDEIIEGPCKVVDRILSDYQYDKLIDFTRNKTLGLLKNKHDLVLEQDDDLEPENIYSGPRIGLSNKYPKYQNRNYRFAIFKNRIKKQKTKLTPISDQ